MKPDLESVRIDKWLWAVRLFKTRSMAADACKKGKVLMGGTNMKASREVKVGDVVQIKRPPVVFSFKVLALSENRMGAKLVPDFMENVTPADQYEILELARFSITGLRDRGTGRPTKRDRRQLMDYITPEDADDGFEFDEDGGDSED
jgi:ribosome-associated heat shock protein Hsp15